MAAIYKGRSYVFLDGMRGHDEITDHALIDIMTDECGFPSPGATALRSRAREGRSVVPPPARSQCSNALVIFMPIKRSRCPSARIELLCDQDPILLNGPASRPDR